MTPLIRGPLQRAGFLHSVLPGAQSERIGERPNALTGGGLSGFRALKAEKEDLPIQGKPAAPGQECRPSHTIWVWFH